MRNYVLRWTRDGHRRTQGHYVTQGMGYSIGGSAPDIDGAYVFNTRMSRASAMHLADQKRLDDWGVEIVYVSLAEAR